MENQISANVKKIGIRSFGFRFLIMVATSKKRYNRGCRKFQYTEILLTSADGSSLYSKYCFLTESHLCGTHFRPGQRPKQDRACTCQQFGFQVSGRQEPGRIRQQDTACGFRKSSRRIKRTGKQYLKQKLLKNPTPKGVGFFYGSASICLF